MYSPLLRKNTSGNELCPGAIWSPIRLPPPEPGCAPPLRKRRTHLFSGFQRESTSMRTKMAVDLTVARRQLGEALGDFSQTYDHLFFSLFKETLIECYFIFFVLILRYWNNMKLWYKQKVISIINTVYYLSVTL